MPKMSASISVPLRMRKRKPRPPRLRQKWRRKSPPKQRAPVLRLHRPSLCRQSLRLLLQLPQRRPRLLRLLSLLLHRRLWQSLLPE
jgi:hypothetical protein